MNMQEVRKNALELMPEGGLELLRDIFTQTISAEIGIPVNPFRAKHSKQRAVIDKLEPNFLFREHDNKQQQQVYRLKRLALLVLDDPKAERIIQHMEALLHYLNR